ncbi:MAG: histone deacetylase family protein [Neisseriaceae bacterium]|nr:histone deacetylase family protein [Neisseriaceae bacterium]
MAIEWLTQHFTHQGLTAYVTHPDCLSYEVEPDNPECPARLMAIKDQLMSSRVFDFLQEFEAEPVTDIQLSRVHPPRYIHQLEALVPAEPHVFNRLNSDMSISSGTMRAIRLAAGAVVQAVDLVLNFQVPNAFCAIRPPGHHACTEETMGFCFVNNVAVGAMHALAEHRLSRVAIVDFDVHHGNGTEEIFQDDDRVMLLSAFQEDLFPYSGAESLGSNPNIIKSPLKSGTKSQGFREMVEATWLPKLHDFQPELIMISAGFDGHLEDDMGNFGLVEADYQWVTEQVVAIANHCCGGKIVSTLEGGYDPSSLGRSVVAHIKALIDA